MNLFLSFLFWMSGFNADLPPSEIQSFRQSNVQRVVPLTRSTPVRPKATPRSRAGGGTVIILEDTHFKPNL